MPTLDELQARLDRLQRQRHSGVARVTVDGRTVEYRGDAEIVRALQDLERQIKAVQGTAPVRQIRIYADKGL